MVAPNRKWLLCIVAALLAAAGAIAWLAFRPGNALDGVAGSNGRLEAVDIDIACRTAGRIREILVDEGDFVRAGQVLARMDTQSLDAQLREAQAQLERARIGVSTAASMVTQAIANREAARAVIMQRDSEQDAAGKRLERTEQLAQRGMATRQGLDDDRARMLAARAASAVARAQLAAAEAAVGSARSQEVAARTSVEAAQATVERIDADLADSILTSPRDGRVQYRIAQPGEVLAAGGKVLSLLDLSDVYMSFFLPTRLAGRIAIGAEARIVLDAAPQYVIPATVSFVSDVAQFTPKTVETAEEREKLMFRIKARIAPDLLRRHIRQVKTGLPGIAYVRIDPNAPWPDALRTRLPEAPAETTP